MAQNEPEHNNTCFSCLRYANSNCADQTAHMRSRISAVACSLCSLIKSMQHVRSDFHDFHVRRLIGGWHVHQAGYRCVLPLSSRAVLVALLFGHPEPEKKILLAFLSTFWHPCSKCILMCFKKYRGGCQVWKCPKVPELGQRSTECKFLYMRQILAFSSLAIQNYDSK